MRENKVKIFIDPISQIMKILIYQESPNGDWYVAQNIGDLVFKQVDPYREIEKATIELPRDFARGLLKSLAEEIDKQGVKTDTDAKIQGKLEAVKEHLEDMRALVFGRKRAEKS